ncbi:MAG: PQQ-binding-like beta-propeller repeat protein [Spirochaetes bacterium]|jgi:outer membrane protein assembly factor BamB|nr:PQQ-binding-like beta-propeller repeat protein [Spirochaetota bacterium]
MQRNEEISSIIKKLSRKKAFSGMDTDKLEVFFGSAELHVPEGLLDEELAFMKIKSAIRRESRARTGFFKSHARGIAAASVSAVATAALSAVLIMNGILEPLFPDFFGRGIAYNIFGDVKVARDGSTSRLKTGDRIKSGDVVIAAKESFADLNFGDRIRIRLVSESRLTVDESVSGGNNKFTARLVEGGVILKIDGLVKGDSVALKTPDSTAFVTGTVFSAVTDASGSRFEVYRGKIRVREADLEGAADTGMSGGGSVDVAENSVCSVEAKKTAGKSGDAPKYDIRVVPSLQGKPVLREETDGFLSSIKSVQPGRLKSLRVFVNPADAMVMIDGMYRRTGGGEFSVTVGVHSISVLADGYLGKTENIEIGWMNQDVTVNLEKMQGGDLSGEHSPSYMFAEKGGGGILAVTGKGRVSLSDSTMNRWVMDLSVNVSVRPAYDGSLIYIPTNDGRIIALNPASGVVEWQVRTIGTPSGDALGMDNDAIYAVTDAKHLYKIKKNGRILWLSLFDSPILASPAIGVGSLYVSLDDGMLFCVDPANGQKRYSMNIGEAVGSIATAGNSVFAASGSSLYRIDPARKFIIWKRNDYSRSGRSFIADSGEIYFITGDGGLVKLNNDGQSWRAAVPGWTTGSPLFTMDNIIVSGKGLYKIDRKTGTVSEAGNSLMKAAIEGKPGKKYPAPAGAKKTLDNSGVPEKYRVKSSDDKSGIMNIPSL